MAAGSGFLTGAAKLWVYPTFGLFLVGAPILAGQWSDTFANTAGTTAGTVVSDGPDLVNSFQSSLDTTATGGGATAGEAAAKPFQCLDAAQVVVAKAADGTCPVGSTPKEVVG